MADPYNLISDYDADTIVWASLLASGGSFNSMNDLVDEYCNMKGIYGEIPADDYGPPCMKRHIVFDVCYDKLKEIFSHDYTAMAQRGTVKFRHRYGISQREDYGS